MKLFEYFVVVGAAPELDESLREALNTWRPAKWLAELEAHVEPNLLMVCRPRLGLRICSVPLPSDWMHLGAQFPRLCTNLHTDLGQVYPPTDDENRCEALRTFCLPDDFSLMTYPEGQLPAAPPMEPFVFSSACAAFPVAADSTQTYPCSCIPMSTRTLELSQSLSLLIQTCVHGCPPPSLPSSSSLAPAPATACARTSASSCCTCSSSCTTDSRAIENAISCPCASRARCL
eukprot:SAG11_NODE_1818_length_4215_cov_1.631438_4_plen_232_part_00